jgi:hypothetical protein
MTLFHAYVLNDGGFEFGMDVVTPASWRFTRRQLKRGIYREWLLPAYMDAWAKANPTWFGSYNELQRICASYRNPTPAGCTPAAPSLHC